MEEFMGIFDRKKVSLPPLISDEELFPSVNFDSVLDWLVGLSAEEYEKVCKVATIHRNALQESAAVLGKANEPYSQIDDPKDELQTIPPVLIDKEPAFLTEDEKPKTKSRAIKVKD